MSKYAELCAYGRRGATLKSIAALLGWDQETYMPRGGGDARAEQMALMAGMMHERGTSEELGNLIAGCEDEDLDAQQWACVREFRRDYDKQMKLDKPLVEELARTGSKAQDLWKEARKNNDFKSFAPLLSSMVELSREKAKAFGYAEGGELYDALLDEYEHNATAKEVETVFTPLGEQLSALVKELQDSGKAPNDAPTKIHAPSDRQHALGLHVLKAIGFDLNAGRLDITTHPFCEGLAPGDTRLTTRYDEEYFPGALYGTMHEAGHGMYEQGLPKSGTHEGPGGEAIQSFGTPLADDISLGIHESQSRMWENMVGRSRPFWKWIYQEACDQFAELGKFDQEEVYRAVNIVRPTYIRVEADEGTYNLHVMLRFGIERALISGDLSVNDLPGAWNERFKDMLGLDVPDDTNGCLQDVHWSFGLFGYFPTYTLGNLYAAQLWQTISQQVPGLDNDFAKGDFGRLKQWLNENVHAHGRRYGAGELCEKVTGRPLESQPLMEYLGGKLREVYKI
ncbi:MAG: carboxypeptidase M32 [Phycisphaera sp.]|nr:MAG: carboxypeptidase M32 [Phycisphaera sp.]